MDLVLSKRFVDVNVPGDIEGTWMRVQEVLNEKESVESYLCAHDSSYMLGYSGGSLLLRLES